jgi:hypothetical protein
VRPKHQRRRAGPRSIIAAEMLNVARRSAEQTAWQAAAVGDADHALTATFRYFVGFHSRASRCASAI